MARSVLGIIQIGIVYHVKNVLYGLKDNDSALCCLVTSQISVANLNHDVDDVHQNTDFLMNHVMNIFHRYTMNHVMHIFHRHIVSHVNNIFHLFTMTHARNILHLKGILHLIFLHLQDWDFHQRLQYRLHRPQYRLHHRRQHHRLKANHSPEPTISFV